jgi:hypothetical protein
MTAQTDKLAKPLAEVLEEAGRLQAERINKRPYADSAIQHAVMNVIERDYNLPVTVKYGDDNALQEKYGRSNDRVWGTGGREDWTRFRIEPNHKLSDLQRQKLDGLFLAIGAAKLGKTAMCHNDDREEWHYLWPKTHPVTELVPNPETSV